MGRENNFLWLEGETEGGGVLRCASFQNIAEMEDSINKAFDDGVIAIGNLTENVWNGNSKIEMKLKGVVPYMGDRK